jgi:type II secretory pathway component PulF
MRLRETMRPPRRRRYLRGARDRILWSVPIYRSVVRERSLADVCTAVADALELGFPLDQSLERIEGLDLNLVMRLRIRHWKESLAKGRLPQDAARDARLPRFLVGMLATARSGGDLPEVLRFAARFYRDRFVVRRELLLGAYLPAVTLVMGAIVAGIAIGIFLPLSRLAETLGGAKLGGL